MGIAIIYFANLGNYNLGYRTIFGSFALILLLLAFYIILKNKANLKNVAFLVILGTVLISTLILFALAFDTISDEGIF